MSFVYYLQKTVKLSLCYKVIAMMTKFISDVLGKLVAVKKFFTK